MPRLSEKIKKDIESFNFEVLSSSEIGPDWDDVVVTICCNVCRNVKNIKQRSVYGNIRCRKCNSQSCTYTKEQILQTIESLNYSIDAVKWQNNKLSYSNFWLRCRKCSSKRFVKYIPDLKRRNKCTHCLYNSFPKNDFEDKIAKGNLVLLGEFTNLNKPVTVKCLQCGKITKYKYANNIFKKPICSSCYKHDRFSLETVIAKCKEHGVEYLDNEYKCAGDIHSFKCKAGHIFNTSVSKIIHRKQYCAICSKRKINEHFLFRMLTMYLPNIMIVRPFVINIPIYNDNKLIKTKVLVDFLVGNKLLIEYNGEQHYKPVTFGSQSKEAAKKSFDNQVIRDNWLKNYAIQNDFTLIEIDGRVIHGQEVEKYVQNNIVPMFNGP